MTADELDGLELGQAIEAVRKGLAWAADQGGSSSVRFLVDTVTLELTVELRHTASAGGGMRAWVVTAEGRGERAAANTQRITVVLRTPQSVEIRSEGSERFGPDAPAGDYIR
ncbi:trypco2 family protein [Streptomyces sp. NPDC090306]|uniref:trypco2 family protein n=1 Tax=unclassified Streptomyces TaxID=2593676 RepID=UPI0036E053AB